MTKALFINGSLRKNGNTAQLLKRAMEGAKGAGAEVELINLYDRSLNYKGCMSCFACKIKGGKKGICSFKCHRDKMPQGQVSDMLQNHGADL